jgi:hypothetical protein
MAKSHESPPSRCSFVQGTVVTSPPQVHTGDAAVHANAQQFADPFRRQIGVVGIGILLSLRPKENTLPGDTQWIVRQNMISIYIVSHEYSKTILIVIVYPYSM